MNHWVDITMFYSLFNIDLYRCKLNNRNYKVLYVNSGIYPSMLHTLQVTLKIFHEPTLF